VTPDPESPYRLPPPLHRLINGGEARHPVENTLALLALGLGVTSILCLALGSWDASGWLGLGAGLVAAYDEFTAKTSGERWLILIAFVLAILGLTVSLANGGIL
jgi:hypothetical protein